MRAPTSQRANTVQLGYDHHTRALVFRARTLWARGLPDQADTAARLAVDQTATLAHPEIQRMAILWTVPVLFWVGDFAGAAALVDILETHASHFSLRAYDAFSLGLRGCLSVRRGQSGDGVRDIRTSLEALHAIRCGMVTSGFTVDLAEGLAAMLRVEEALATVERALATVERNGERFYLPELLDGMRLAMTIESNA
jgi:hypothetical protein